MSCRTQLARQREVYVVYVFQLLIFRASDVVQDPIGQAARSLCCVCVTGNLSPSHPARDSCTICGDWVPSSQAVLAFLCMQHKKMRSPGTEYCGLCELPLQGRLEKGKSQAKMCNRCGFGITRCSALNF